MKIQVSHGADGKWFIVAPAPGEPGNTEEVQSLLHNGRSVYELDVAPWQGHESGRQARQAARQQRVTELVALTGDGLPAPDGDEPEELLPGFKPQNAITAVNSLVVHGTPVIKAIVDVVDVLSPAQRQAVVDYVNERRAQRRL